MKQKRNYVIKPISELLNLIDSVDTFDLAFRADSSAMGCPDLFFILINNTLHLGNMKNCKDPIYKQHF